MRRTHFSVRSLHMYMRKQTYSLEVVNLSDRDLVHRDLLTLLIQELRLHITAGYPQQPILIEHIDQELQLFLMLLRHFVPIIPLKILDLLLGYPGTKDMVEKP